MDSGGKSQILLENLSIDTLISEMMMLLLRHFSYPFWFFEFHLNFFLNKMTHNNTSLSITLYSNSANICCLIYSFLFITRKIFSFRFDFTLNFEKRQFSMISPWEIKCSNVSYLWTFPDYLVCDRYMRNLTIVVFNSPSQRWYMKWVDKEFITLMCICGVMGDIEHGMPKRPQLSTRTCVWVSMAKK